MIAAYRMVAFGEYADDNSASAMKARDYKDATDLAVSVTGDIAHTLKAEGFDGSEDGTGRGVPTIAFSSKDYGADATHDLSPTLRAGGHANSHANAGVPPAVAMPLNTQIIRRGGAMGRSTETYPCLTLHAGHSHGVFTAPTIGFQSSQSGVQLVDTHATPDTNNGPRRHNGVVANPPAVAHTLGTQCSWATEDGTGRGSPLVPSSMAVRRLTPTECERLQGFPDGYTLVPYRSKPAADGPRYKALGNSMAVPVMRWIGNRMNANGENQ